MLLIKEGLYYHSFKQVQLSSRLSLVEISNDVIYPLVYSSSLAYNFPIMKYLYMPILVAILLLVQWGVLGHDFHIHDTAETCDYCVSAHALDHAVTSTEQAVSVSPILQYQPEQAWVSASINSFYHYAARAPPRFI